MAGQNVPQRKKYDSFYGRGRRLRWLFRFDVRYRCRRMHEVAEKLGLSLEDKSVLDVGFGSGLLLASFPKSCRLTGAEISQSAVDAAATDPLFEGRGATFVRVSEDNAEDLPKGPYDVVMSSHAIEHVPDDLASLKAMRLRIAAGGRLFLFVPIEEPNYNPDHVRNYSLETIQERAIEAGFDVEYAEGSMHINGHVWKIITITIPSRRRWPVLKPIVDSFRLFTLSLIPYRLKLLMDRGLSRIGVRPRQAFLICSVAAD